MVVAGLLYSSKQGHVPGNKIEYVPATVSYSPMHASLYIYFNIGMVVLDNTRPPIIQNGSMRFIGYLNDSGESPEKQEWIVHYDNIFSS